MRLYPGSDHNPLVADIKVQLKRLTKNTHQAKIDIKDLDRNVGNYCKQ